MQIIKDALWTANPQTCNELVTNVLQDHYKKVDKNKNIEQNIVKFHPQLK